MTHGAKNESAKETRQQEVNAARVRACKEVEKTSAVASGGRGFSSRLLKCAYSLFSANNKPIAPVSTGRTESERARLSAAGA